MDRIDKVNYYLRIAESVSARSTCMKKHYGAVVVKNDHIVSTGYNGAPRGRQNCCEVGKCARLRNNIVGTNYGELCRSVHAEANAIIQAAPEELDGATMYLFGLDLQTNSFVKDCDSCTMCKRLIINSGIKSVICCLGFVSDDVRYDYIVRDVDAWVKHDDTLGTFD